MSDMSDMERQMYAYALFRCRWTLRLMLGRLLFRRAFTDVEMPE